jgi:hypothetical protein
MIVAIHQPNYIPWLGYFRKVVSADVFVFFDNVQMPMGKSYVTRNLVKIPAGPLWLTVPVEKLGDPGLIAETRIVAGPWARKHAATLRGAYAGSAGFTEVLELLESAYRNGHERIADLNIEIIERVTRHLGATELRFVRASEMKHGRTGAESIVPILEELGATAYLTGHGSGSMRHLDTGDLAARGIETRFVDEAFPPYPQRHGDFVPNLSIVDALLNLGAPAVMRLLKP